MPELRLVRLGDHIGVLSGFPFPSEQFSDREGMPLIRIRDLLSDAIETFFASAYPDDYVVNDGDVLIGMDGDFNVVRWDRGPALLNQRVCRVASTSEQLDQGYLFWLLGPQLERIHRRTPQTTVKHLSTKDLYEIRAEVPPGSEQRLVARILDTLDTQIRRTEALIAKLEQIKQGLLTDLLTRGIDENGQLRPPPDQAPHLYKDSPLGRVPREWDVLTLSDLLSSNEPAMRSGPFGSALLKSELVSAGIPLLGIDNVRVEDFRTDFTRFVTAEKFRELARYAVRPNDLMITIMGTVGRCCLVPESIGPALSSKHTWTISLDEDCYISYLAMLQINYSPWVLQHFARDEQGGIMSAIRSDTLRSTPLPVPPINEQRLIAVRLRSISDRIASEQSQVAKLKSHKRGLMDDLLTGRVRVTPLLDKARCAETISG